MPIAVAGFFLFSYFPHNTRVWYINEEGRIRITYYTAFSIQGTLPGQGDCQSATPTGRSSTETTVHKGGSPQDPQAMAHIPPAPCISISFINPQVKSDAYTELCSFFCGAAAAGTVQPIFALYLKASKYPKYTIAQINNYPTTSSTVGIVSMLAHAWISDGILNGRR